MAEAPISPPGLDYNSFRAWRKNNGISATREELSVAWSEYSGKTSPPRRSPTKKSPIKKSPTRRIPAGVSLLDVPREIGEYVVGKLPEKEVATMRRVSTQTGRLTNQEIARICRLPVTLKEFLRVANKLSLPFGVAIKQANSMYGSYTKYLVTDESQVAAMRAHRLSCPKLAPDYVQHLQGKYVKDVTRGPISMLLWSAGPGATPITNEVKEAALEAIRGTGTIQIPNMSTQTIMKRVGLRSRILLLMRIINWLNLVENEQTTDDVYATLPANPEEAGVAYAIKAAEQIERVRKLYRE